MKTSEVIGFCGKAGVGKTTTANALIEYITPRHAYYRPATIVSFAEPLKELARDFFGWDGQKDERGRRLLQQLGTDVGRSWDPEFWVKKWTAKAEQWMKRGSHVIVDDVRFQNEVDAIIALGGTVFQLDSETRGLCSSHASETQKLQGVTHMNADDISPGSLAAIAANIVFGALGESRRAGKEGT